MGRMKDQTAGTSWLKAPRGSSERINIFPAFRLANLWPYDLYVSKQGRKYYRLNILKTFGVQ